MNGLISQNFHKLFKQFLQNEFILWEKGKKERKSKMVEETLEREAEREEE